MYQSLVRVKCISYCNQNWANINYSVSVWFILLKSHKFHLWLTKSKVLVIQKKMLHHVITRALSCSLNLTTYLFCKSDTGGDRNEAKAKSGTKAKPSFQTTACGSFHLASSRRIWSFALFKARASLKVDLFVWGCFSIYFCIYQDHPVLGAKWTVGFVKS